MRSGRLNKKVNIEQRISVSQADGGTRLEWQVLHKSVWAGIEPMRGREWFTAGGTQTEADHLIRMRYRKGIRPSMRVTYKDRIFDIQHVANIRTDNRELHLMCKEYDESPSQGA